MGTYSGLLGEIFLGAQEGLKIWADAANACGGLNGHQIRVISEDDQGDPSTALTETENMVNNDHVIAFVGDFVPLSLGGIPQYLASKGIPAIGGDGTTPAWYQNPILFPESASVNVVGQGGGELSAKQPGGKVALYYCSDAPVQCGWWGQGAEQGVKAGGGQLVAQGQPTLTAPSYTAQCQQAKSAGATTVMIGLDQSGVTRFVANCSQQANYNPQYVSLGFAIISKQTLANPMLNNMIIPTMVFPWSDNSIPVDQAYQAAIKNYDPGFGDNGGEAAGSWVSGILAQEAAKYLSASNPSPAQFLQGLYSIKNNTLGGATAPLTFAQGKNPQVGNCYFVVQVKSGAFASPQGAKPTCY